MEFRHQNEHVMSYSIYKHDKTLKMAFGEFFFYNFNTGPPNITPVRPITTSLKLQRCPFLLVIIARFICMFYAHFLCGFISSTWVNAQVIQFIFVGLNSSQILQPGLIYLQP